MIDELHCQDKGLQNEDYWDRQNVSKSSVITSESLTKKRGKILSPSSKVSLAPTSGEDYLLPHEYVSF